MKSIETKWKGWRFRSRTEARWAVFLEALGLTFEYEPEGLVLPSGPYLPDFRIRGFDLPRGCEPQDVWLEIKGSKPTDAEMLRCNQLAQESGALVLIAEGAPDFSEQVLAFEPDITAMLDGLSPDARRHEPTFRNLLALLVGPLAFMVVGEGPDMALCLGRGPRDSSLTEAADGPVDAAFQQSMAVFDGVYCRVLGIAGGVLPVGQAKVGMSRRVADAYDKSRSARFEFGETENRWDP